MSGININTPSPVLMIRSVPPGKAEKDLQEWAQSYDFFDKKIGAVRKTQCTKSLLLADREIGFVQMGSIEEAIHIMDMYINTPQFVKMDGSFLNLIYSDKHEITAAKKTRNQIPTSQTRILLVVLKDLSATIMMDELFWIFSQFGIVEKLSSFTKNHKNQVLVQYLDHKQASSAMSYLNGKEIHFVSSGNDRQEGKCELAIVPSKLPELTFKNQDQKNRDYTQINQHLQEQFIHCRMDRSQLKPYLERCCRDYGWRMKDFLWGQWVLGNGWLDPKQEERCRGSIPVDQSGPQRGIPEGQVGNCVHISELTTDKQADRAGYPRHGGIDAKMLWRLCGMYGDIIAVKMLFKYEGSAIVQFKSSEYANACIECMKDSKLWGKEWIVKRSKNANAMHWSGANTELDARMVTILTDEPPPSPAAQNFAPPCETLVMWDMPDGLTDDDLVELFQDYGRTKDGHYGRVDTVDINKESNTAQIVMDTTEDAVIAASLMNGRTIFVNGKTFQIKLYFDKQSRREQDDYEMPRSMTNAGVDGRALMARTFTV